MSLWLPLTTALLGGLFTLGGVWIASRLTSSREHRRWVLDNKKLEWRELIDEMQVCFNRMVYAFQDFNVISGADDSNDPEAGMRKGYRILRNRIFIADAIAEHKIMEQWQELLAYVHSARMPREPRQQGAPTHVGYNERAGALQDRLMEVARLDIEVATNRRWFRF